MLCPIKHGEACDDIVGIENMVLSGFLNSSEIKEVRYMQQQQRESQCKKRI